MPLDLSFLLPNFVQVSFHASTALIMFLGAWIVVLQASRHW